MDDIGAKCRASADASKNGETQNYGGQDAARSWTPA